MARAQDHPPETDRARLINGEPSKGMVAEIYRRCQVRCDGRTLHLTKRTKMSFEEMLNQVQAAGEAALPSSISLPTDPIMPAHDGMRREWSRPPAILISGSPFCAFLPPRAERQSRLINHLLHPTRWAESVHRFVTRPGTFQGSAASAYGFPIISRSTAA